MPLFAVPPLLLLPQAAVLQHGHEFTQLYTEKVQYMKRTAAAEVRRQRAWLLCAWPLLCCLQRGLVGLC
jgi:hypothetical protein